VGIAASGLVKSDARARVATIEARIAAGHQANRADRRLAAIPGPRVLTASTLVVSLQMKAINFRPHDIRLMAQSDIAQ
jgi:hypothetical protein